MVDRIRKEEGIEKRVRDSNSKQSSLGFIRGGRLGTRSGSDRVFWIFGYFGIEV